MIHKSIRVPLYHQNLQIMICEDVEKEIEEINKKFYVSKDRLDFAGFASTIDNYHLILLNKKHIKSESFAVSTIAHEALHITSFIFKRVGIKPDVKNDEAQAYLISWIVEETFKQYKKS